MATAKTPAKAPKARAKKNPKATATAAECSRKGLRARARPQAPDRNE